MLVVVPPPDSEYPTDEVLVMGERVRERPGTGERARERPGGEYTYTESSLTLVSVSTLSFLRVSILT